MTETLIINGECISETTLEKTTLGIKENTICSIGNKQGNYSNIIDATNLYITPGLIDIHIHGGYGCNFLDTTRDKIDLLNNNLIQHGICALLPTIMTATKEEMLSSINFLSSLKQNSKHPALIGLNIEGPFLSNKHKGIHPSDKLIKLNNNELEKFLTDKVRIITIAPETGLTEELIQKLESQNITVALGHSGATYEQVIYAAKSGVKLITHLYNAMSKFHHREPGILGAALTNDELFVELICDGFHVHPAAIELAIKAKPSNKIILISDCIALRDSKEDNYYVSKDKITVKGGRPVNKKGTLSGSILTLDKAIQNLVEWKLVDFKTALKFASYNPAKLLNISDKYGDIKEGAIACLTFWDKETLKVKATMINGHFHPVDWKAV